MIFVKTGYPCLSRWRVDSALGTVTTDINSAATANQVLTGSVRGPTDPDTAILFNIVPNGLDFLAGDYQFYIELSVNAGFTQILAPGSSMAVNPFSAKAERILTGGVPAGTDAWVFGNQMGALHSGFYWRPVIVAKKASSSIVLTWQLATP